MYHVPNDQWEERHVQGYAGYCFRDRTRPQREQRTGVGDSKRKEVQLERADGNRGLQGARRARVKRAPVSTGVNAEGDPPLISAQQHLPRLHETARLLNTRHRYTAPLSVDVVGEVV